MKCKNINNDLISYAEESLSADRRDYIDSHKADCSECKEFIFSLEEALEVIESDKEVIENPFLYTRLLTKLDTNEKDSRTNAKRFIPAFLFAATLFLGILGGISLGKFYSDNTSGYSSDLQEEISYIDDFMQEPIENFFLTSNEEEND